MAIKRRIKKFFSYVEMWEDPNNRATKKLSMADREKMVLNGTPYIFFGQDDDYFSISSYNRMSL